MTTKLSTPRRGAHPRGRWRRALGVLLLCALAASPAAGQEEKKKKKQNFTVSEWANARLLEAQEHLNNELYAESLEILQRMERRRSLSNHEKALMWQTFGYVHSSQEDYAKAAEAFENCLAQDALVESTALQTQYNLAQLYMAQENFERALELLEDWFKRVTNPTGAAYNLLAIAHVQNEDYPSALKPALSAVEKSGPIPKEPWMQLLLSIHFELKQMEEVGGVLKRLVSHYPKRTYYVQLAQVNMELGREAEALAVLEIAYLDGLLEKEQEFLTLASLYLYNNVPFKAGLVLEAALGKEVVEGDEQNWNMLANAWLHAREYERALKPLAKAASLSEKGDLYFQLGQVHVEREQWQEAEGALKKAVAKGNLRDPGNAYVLLGIVHFNQKKWKLAKDAFKRAAKEEKTRKTARSWMRYVEREQEKADREAATG